MNRSPASRALAALLLAPALLLGGCVRPAPADDARGALPPRDGVADVWHVRPGADPSGSDGSASAPFADLAAVAAAATTDDVIVLHEGVLYGSLALLPGQSLVAADGERVVLRGAPGAAVTLAAYNEVRGLRIAAPAAEGIAGRVYGTIVLQDVRIEDAGADGVRVEADGSVDVRLEGVRVEASAGHGVRVEARGGDARVALRGSSLVGNAGNGAQLAFLGAGDARVEASGNPEVRSGVAGGIRVFAAGAGRRLEAVVRDNAVASHDPATAGVGIAVVLEDGARGAAVVSGNRVRGFGAYGIDLSARAGASELHAVVEGNSVTDPAPFALAGMRLAAGNGTGEGAATLCARLVGNDVRTGALPAYAGRSDERSALRLDPASDPPGGLEPLAAPPTAPLAAPPAASAPCAAPAF